MIAGLEQALQQGRDPETLAVYADALEAAGDPRGELIAIDLELAKVRQTTPVALDRVDELVERKRDVLQRWLGDTIAGVPWHPRQFEHGLLREITFAATSTQSIAEYARGVLESPVGPYLAGLVIDGGKAELEQAMALVGGHPLPWLRRLTLQRVAEAGNKRTVAHEPWQGFVAATPNLVDLSVIGSGAVRSPIHPSVRTLRVVGGDAIVIGAEGIPGVTTLDLAFRDPEDFLGRPRATPDTLAALVNPRTFPALRVLDLTRNEGHPEIVTAGTGGAGARQIRHRPIEMFLDAVEDVGRFDRLRLPSSSGDHAAAYLRRLLDAHPRLTIESPRIWTDDGELVHPRLEVVERRPWPGQGKLHGRDGLTIALPSDAREHVALSSIVRHLAEQFDAMPPEAQAAWGVFWDRIDELVFDREGGEVPIDAATLLRALDSLDDNQRCDSAAKLLRDADLPAGATVTLAPYWGL